MALATVTTAASAVIRATPGMLGGVVLAAGSDTATVIIYDNGAAGSGTVLCKLTAVTNTSACAVFPTPVAASKGLWAVVTGTAMSTTVYFS